MNKRILLLSSFFAVTGCSTISNNSYYFPILKQVPSDVIEYFSSKNNSLTNEFIEQQKYSFMHAIIGDQDATLVLRGIEDNVFYWVGKDNVEFYTYRGFIIKTYGLEHNMELLNSKSSIDNLLSMRSSPIEVSFDKPRLYQLTLMPSTYNEHGSSRIYSFKAEDIKWNLEIKLENDQFNMPISVTQNIHPFMNTVQIRYYFKY